MSRLTYRGGADGLGDPDATLLDCPLCGQAVRVDLAGDRLSLRCYGGCDAEQVFEALAVPQVVMELVAA